jgi:hypothetical protein
MNINQTTAEAPPADTRAWREKAWGKQPSSGRGGSRPGSGRPKGAATRKETFASQAERHAREIRTLLKKQVRERTALAAKLAATPKDASQ